MLQSNCQTTLTFHAHMLIWDARFLPYCCTSWALTQRFWGHGVPFCTDLRAAGGTSVYLKVTRRGFLLRRQPRWSSVWRWLVTRCDQWPAKVQRTAALGMAMFDLNCLKSLEDWRWCTDTWWGLPRKIKNRYIDFRWRWSMYINASYSVSLGRAKVFPPESLRCDDSPIAFVSSICFYGWAIVVSLFLCYGNPLQKVGFATANWNFWNPLRIGALVLL